MGKFNGLFSSFQSGEVSPRIFGRSNTQEYQTACEKLKNFQVLPQGGARRRPGSIYRSLIASGFGSHDWNFTDDPTQTFRLLPFHTTDDRKFVLVARTSATVSDWVIVDVDTGQTYSPAPLSDVAVTTWSSTDILALQFAQTGDYLGIVSPFQRPLGLVWNGANFTLGYHHAVLGGISGNELAKRRAYLDINALNNQSQGTLTATLISGSNYTITSSSNIFRAGHVGANFKLTNASAVTGVFTIIAFTNTGTVTGNLLTGTAPSGAVGVTAGTSWEEEAWSGVRGFPGAITFYEQRAIYGGTPTAPNTLYCSQTGDIQELMYRPLEQDAAFATYTSDITRAFSFSYAAGETNSIRWLSSGKSLFIGTTSREYYAQGGATGFGLTTVSVTAATAFGSIAKQAIRQENSAVFIQRSGIRIRDLTFNFQEDDYKSQDLTLMAEHLSRRSLETWSNLPTVPQFTELAQGVSPFTHMWALDNRGGLFGLTADKDTNFIAWAHHLIGGQLVISGTSYPPKVLSMCILPSTSGVHDDLWMLVYRTVNGTDKVYMERIGRGFEGINYINSSTSLDDKMFNLDCTARVSAGSPTTTFAFPHLPNATVGYFADGVYQGTTTLDSSGNLTSAVAASEIIAGYLYQSRLVTVGLEAGAQYGSAKGRLKKSAELVVGLYKSLSAKIGVKLADSGLEDLQPQTLGTGLAAGTLFSGEVRVHLPGYDRDYRLIVQADDGLPCEVAYMGAEGVTYDT